MMYDIHFTKQDLEEVHALYLFLFVPVHSVQNQDLLWSPADDKSG